MNKKEKKEIHNLIYQLMTLFYIYASLGKYGAS
jgi:hypothetical protein